MSANYVVSRIKEALYNSKGNKAKAVQQLLSWAQQDTKLLVGLTRAHLKGIVAYNVDRVASGKAVGGGSNTARAAKTADSQKKMVNVAKGSVFGQEILKAASDQEAAIFGLESYSSPTKPSKVSDKTSQRHVDALKHIASFSKKTD